MQKIEKNAKLTLPEAIVYGHKDPNTKAYFDKARKIAEKRQDKIVWAGPTAGYHALEQMHSKYNSPKINVIRDDERPMYNYITDVMKIPNPTNKDFGRFSKEIFLRELSHKAQRNKSGILGFAKKHSKDLLNTLKNIDSNNIFDKQKWINAYNKNYKTTGTLENEAHSVITPKLKEEYNKIFKKQVNRLESMSKKK
jgi:hypothetical protein